MATIIPEYLWDHQVKYELLIRGASCEGDFKTLCKRLRASIEQVQPISTEHLKSLELEECVVEVEEQAAKIVTLMDEYSADPTPFRPRQIIARLEHLQRRIEHLQGIQSSEESQTEDEEVLFRLNSAATNIRTLLSGFQQLLLEKPEPFYDEVPSMLNATPSVSVTSVAADVSQGVSQPVSMTTTSAPTSSIPQHTPVSNFGFSSCPQPSFTPAFPYVTCPTSTFIPSFVPRSNPLDSVLFSQASSINFNPVIQSTGINSLPSRPLPSVCEQNPSAYFGGASFSSYISSSQPSFVNLGVRATDRPSFSSQAGSSRVSRFSNQFKIKTPIERHLKQLPDADGLDHQVLLQFLAQALLIREKAGWSDEELLDCLQHFTRRPLADFVTSALVQHLTFDKFHEEVLSALLPLRIGNQLRFDTLNRLQGEDETLISYVQEMRIQAQVLQLRLSERQLVDQIISNVNPKTRALIAYNDKPKSLHGLLQLCINAQDYQYADSHRPRTSNRSSFTKLFSSEQRFEKARVHNLGSRPEESRPPMAVATFPPDVSRPPPQNSNSQSGSNKFVSDNGRRVMRCFHCSELGHISRNCPNKNQPKN